MPLTDTFLKTLRYTREDGKPQRAHDTNGLYLEVTPKGVRKWQMKYKRPATGKENRLSFGQYPEVSLKEARQKRDDAREQIRNGKDPAEAKKEQKRLQILNSENSFESIAREWYSGKQDIWSNAYSTRVLSSLEQNIFPLLGNYPITSISAPMLLEAARKIEQRGALEVASRALQVCSAIFRYAIACGKAEYDPVPSLKGALKPRTVQHMARISAKELPKLLHDISQYDGEIITRLALQLIALTFVRTGELIGAQWSEFDFEAQEWRIPAERMKMKDPHIVPLSRQALAVLEELKRHTSHRTFVFASPRQPRKPISNNTILFALYRMGYHSRMTGHGFRGLASTVLNEQGFKPDVIERQLAHAERNGVRKAYNHAQYLPERKAMMQHWADYLDGLQSGNVVNVRFGGSAG